MEEAAPAARSYIMNITTGIKQGEKCLCPNCGETDPKNFFPDGKLKCKKCNHMEGGSRKRMST